VMWEARQRLPLFCRWHPTVFCLPCYSRMLWRRREPYRRSLPQEKPRWNGAINHHFALADANLAARLRAWRVSGWRSGRPKHTTRSVVRAAPGSSSSGVVRARREGIQDAIPDTGGPASIGCIEASEHRAIICIAFWTCIQDMSRMMYICPPPHTYLPP